MGLAVVALNRRVAIDGLDILVVRLDMGVLVVAGLDVAGVSLCGQFTRTDAEALLAASAGGDFVGFEMGFGVGHGELLFLSRINAAPPSRLRLNRPAPAIQTRSSSPCRHRPWARAMWRSVP
jgi:hypothetical protein